MQSPTEGRVLRLSLRMCVWGGHNDCELKVKSCLEEEVLCRHPMNHLFSVVFLLDKVPPHIFFPWPVLGAEDAGWGVLSPEDCAVRGCSWSLLDDLEA